MRRLAISGASLAAVGGIVAVVAGVGASSAATNIEGAKGGSGFCAVLTDAIGLYEGNPVTQMGYRVGVVDKITPQGSHVTVSFSLDAGRAYPADVQAVTRSKSLLADRSLELVGNYRSGPTLQKGKCISADRTYTPKSINEVAGSASDFLKGLSDNGGVDLQRALNGADRALAGTGAKAHSMFVNAAGAAGDPDGFTADIGASIRDMAPLTDDAVKNWKSIISIVKQAPSVADLGTKLFYDVKRFCDGIGWTVALVYDVWHKYGHELEPLILGEGVSGVHDLALASKGWKKDLSSLSPAIADALREQTSATGGLSVPYSAPSVKVTPQQCSLLGKACNQGSGKTSTVNLFSLVLQKAGVR